MAKSGAVLLVVVGTWDILIFIFFSGVEHGGERKGGDEGERWLGLAVAVAALMKMNKVEV